VWSPDDRNVCREKSGRRQRCAKDQHGDRAPLQKNFRDWILRYVCNAAVVPSSGMTLHHPASCFGQEGRTRIEQGAEARRSGPGFPGSNSHPIRESIARQRPTRCERKSGYRCEVRAAFSDLESLDLPGENISDASLGLDKLRCAWVLLQFAAKAENLHIYAAIEHVFVDSSRL
jgi:hypothetical protein